MYELNHIQLIGYVGKAPATSAEGKKPFVCFDPATTKRYRAKTQDAKVTSTT